MRLVVAIALTVGATVATGTAATLTSETIAAWDAYVASTEARIERELRSARGFLVQDFADSASAAREHVLHGGIVVSEMSSMSASGGEIPVVGGMIQHWRGTIFVPGVTRDGLLTRLQNPSESGPHQEDVVAIKVMNRRPDELDLFLRVTRTKIVTVTYDTQHHVTYRRHGPARASSRSVATRIAEIADAGTLDERRRPPGEDRGFLWRLNSYWRYEQVTGGVIVELESLTLSRSVPVGLGPIVVPLVDRVARESVSRTLTNLRQTHGRERSAGRPRRS